VEAREGLDCGLASLMLPGSFCAEINDRLDFDFIPDSSRYIQELGRSVAAISNTNSGDGAGRPGRACRLRGIVNRANITNDLSRLGREPER
jgi:hypothetical protein